MSILPKSAIPIDFSQLDRNFHERTIHIQKYCGIRIVMIFVDWQVHLKFGSMFSL